MQTQAVLQIVCFLGITYAKRARYVVQWNGLNSTHNSDYIEKFHNFILPRRAHFTSEVIYKQELPEVRATISLQLPRPPRGALLQLFEQEFDFCKFLSSASSLEGKFLGFLREDFGKYSNFPRRCPLKQQTLYYFRNYTLNMEYVPSFTPETDFVFKMAFHLHTKVELYTFTVRGCLAENVRSALTKNGRCK